jgi:outer membrane protein assembly factor BamA
LCFTFCFLSTNGQTFNLKVITASEKSVISKLNYQKKFNSIANAKNETNNIVLTLQNKGYLLASVDSTINDSNLVTAYISENQQYKLAYLKLGNLNPTLASKLGISEKLFFNKPFKYKEVSKTFEKIISYYENNGYPFVSVKLDSI